MRRERSRPLHHHFCLFRLVPVCFAIDALPFLLLRGRQGRVEGQGRRFARVRRRQGHPPPALCGNCKKRFTTYERVEETHRLTVIKKDGRRVPWDREKIRDGIERACFKRPVEDADKQRVVDEVEEEVFNAYDKEAPEQRDRAGGGRPAPPARPGGLHALRQRLPAVQDAGRVGGQGAGRPRRPAVRHPRPGAIVPRRVGGRGTGGVGQAAAATAPARRPRPRNGNATKHNGPDERVASGSRDKTYPGILPMTEVSESISRRYAIRPARPPRARARCPCYFQTADDGSAAISRHPAASCRRAPASDNAPAAAGGPVRTRFDPPGVRYGFNPA